FAVGINTVADLIFVRSFKVEGLALGHATAYTFAAIAAAVILRRRLGGLEGRRLGLALAQIGLGGALAGAAAFGVSRAVAAMLGVVAFDAGQVVVDQIKAGDVAQTAAQAAADMYYSTKNEDRAKQAGIAAAAEQDSTAVVTSIQILADGSAVATVERPATTL